MGGLTMGWKGVVALLLLSAYPPIRLSAQVGHNPAHSPYQDLQRGSTVRVMGGYFSGSRGDVPVGPTNGATAGLRYAIAASGLFTLTAGIAYAHTDAYFFPDPGAPPPPPRHGPVPSALVLIDAGLQASLTGGKTWHGFQPYVGATLGFVTGSTSAADTSGYTFGTKFTYGPEAGIRWYPVRRVSVELGYRLVVYKLQYPLSYRPNLVSLTSSLSQLTVHPWATFGVGWTF